MATPGGYTCLHRLQQGEPAMPDRDPEPNNPLSPYFPSEVPPLPGTGRRWVALLLVAVLLFSTLVYGVLGLTGVLGG
jgi:hypothetical protein